MTGMQGSPMPFCGSMFNKNNKKKRSPAGPRESFIINLTTPKLRLGEPQSNRGKTIATSRNTLKEFGDYSRELKNFSETIPKVCI